MHHGAMPRWGKKSQRLRRAPRERQRRLTARQVDDRDIPPENAAPRAYARSQGFTERLFGRKPFGIG